MKGKTGKTATVRASVRRASAGKFDFDEVMRRFPKPFKPRDIQVEALRRAVEAYNNGARYVVMDAPTGVGKSLIGMTLGEAVEDAYVLTLTVQLQEQYLRDFEHLGMRVLKGRGKYRCDTMGGGATCHDAKVMKVADRCGANCPYLVAKDAAFAARYCVANYHSYYHNAGRLGGQLDEDVDFATVRALSILDEAHAIEGFLLDQVGVTVNLKNLSVMTPPLPNELHDAGPYLDYVREELLPRLDEAMKRTPDPYAREEFEALIGKLRFVLAAQDDVWIPERGVSREGVVDQTWFALKPLYVARYGPRVWGGGERQLLMSGTVLSAWQLVNNIGLDPSEGEHIELDSPFPPENRPVYVGNLDMTKKAREESWPAVVELVGNILDAHANEKGVLLTPSNEMLEYIRKRLKPKHAQRLVVAYGEDREEKYRLHLQGKRPSVLAASGFWEGADLKDDAARFQIIPAAPRPMWQGQIAARAQKDPAWYRWMTWTKFLQGTGRAVRSEKDYAATYVFDRELRTELARPDSMIPKWFQKAVHLVD